MATNALSFSPISLPSSQSKSLSSTSVLGFFKLSIQLPNYSRCVVSQRISATAAVSSLPILKREGSDSEKMPKWSARTIRSFAMAEMEARKFKYLNTGTESLLIGILFEGTSLAAKFLRANGITLFKVQEETVNLLGRSNLFTFSPEHPPLTEQAQRALDWAINEKSKSGDSGEITTTYLLLGIWSEKQSAGHQILAALGFNDEKAEELAKSKDKEIDLSYKTVGQMLSG